MKNEKLTPRHQDTKKTEKPLTVKGEKSFDFLGVLVPWW
jgi:hypothetical protein